MTAAVPPSDPPALWLWRAGIILGWALILSGVGLFVWDCLLWLRNGAWPPESLSDLWGHAPLGGDGAGSGWQDMRGVHYLLYHVLHWLGPFPISLALIVIGLASAWISNRLHEGVEDRLAESLCRVPVPEDVNDRWSGSVPRRDLTRGGSGRHR